MQITKLYFCTSKNYPYICIDFHLKQATDVRQPLPDWPFLWPIGTRYSTDPRVER